MGKRHASGKPASTREPPVQSSNRAAGPFMRAGIFRRWEGGNKKKLKLETDAANGGLLPTITDRPRTEGLGRTTANEADPTAENSTGGLVRCYYTSSRSSATPDDRGWIPSSVTMLPIIHTRSHGSVSREHGMDPVVNPSIDNFSVDSSISLAPVPRRGLVAVRQTEFYRRLPK